MNNWLLLIGAFFGTGGAAALLAFFFIPAGERHKDMQKWRAKMERKVNRLQRSDANKSSIILVLIQRDEILVSRLRQADSTFAIEPIGELLKRLDLSAAQIVGVDDDDDDEPSA